VRGLGGARQPLFSLSLQLAGLGFGCAEAANERPGSENTAEAGAAGAADGGAGSADAVEACPLLYSEGHGDLFVAFDEGLRLMLRSAFDPQRPETLEPAARVCIIVPAASRTLAESFGGAPAREDYAFLGVSPGAPFWILPAVARADMPWFGLSTEQVPRGHYTGDELQIVLSDVSGPDDGAVAVWSTTGLGVPQAMYSSAQDLRSCSFAVAAHLHFNWSFSMPGEYRLRFRPEGERTRDGQLEQGPDAEFRFVVEP
jgi:surface-anchored protein